MEKELKLVQEWDKTFPLSDKVNHEKVTFRNRFGITLAADLYYPKEKGEEKLAAIAVSGPFGACKEQASGLYAMKMAELGFLTIAFDPSFTGESGGEVRNVASVDINTEDFQAAVDYLVNHPMVDENKISIIGICGWGGLALNAAQIDTRIKVTITSTMYNMSRVNHNAYFDTMTEDELFKQKVNLNNQRTIDYRNGNFALAGSFPDELPSDAPWYVKDYFNYYKGRGYHPRSLNSTCGWNVTSSLTFINTKQDEFLNEIRSAVLIIHGDKAHSCYFSKDAYEKLKDHENAELLLIPGAVHTDLYDNLDVIPFNYMKEFILKHLN